MSVEGIILLMEMALFILLAAIGIAIYPDDDDVYVDPTESERWLDKKGRDR